MPVVWDSVFAVVRADRKYTHIHTLQCLNCVAAIEGGLPVGQLTCVLSHDKNRDQLGSIWETHQLTVILQGLQVEVIGVVHVLACISLFDVQESRRAKVAHALMCCPFDNITHTRTHNKAHSPFALVRHPHTLLT